MKKISILLCALLFLSSCENSTYGNSTLIENNILHYMCVDDLYINSESINDQYGQFILDDTIQINKLEKIIIPQFKQTEDFLKYYLDVFKIFFSENEIEKQDIKESVGGDGLKTISFYNASEMKYCCVGENGFISALTPEAFEISFGNNVENIKIINVDRGESTDEIYKLSDGEYSISDAVSYVDEWLNNVYKPFEPEYVFKVKYVIIRKYNNDDFYYEITAEKYYNDIPLDSLIQTNSFNEETQIPSMQFVTKPIKIQMFRKNEISSFTNGTGSVVPIQPLEVNKIITPHSALEYCRLTFADYNEMNINDVGLKYTLTPVYTEDIIDIPYENQLIKRQSSYEPGMSFSSRLVWEIIIDANPNEFLKKGEINKYGHIRKYIYVDAISGELFFDFKMIDLQYKCNR